MKKIQILGLLSYLLMLSMSPIIAQQNPIYFASGTATLDETAKQYLEELIKDCRQYPDFALDIKAYTDDVGTAKYNERLAKRRATEVAAFFKSKGIEPSTKNISGLGELALKGEKSIAEERRTNRRVDVKITPFAPKSMDELYSFFGKRNTEQFQLNNDKDVTLVGHKGTVLFIPKNSLQRVDGKPLDGASVIMEMREAYSYQDMLLENLATVSDGKLLETGGMVHLAAKTKDGQEVVVKPGAELRLSMPGTGPSQDGMQLFVANRDLNDPSAEINWKATQKPFMAPKGIEIQRMPYISHITKKHQAPGKIDFPIINDIEMKEPLIPTVPSKPEIRAVRPIGERPNEATVIATNPQMEKESKGKYKKRIERALKTAQFNFDNDLAKYERELKRDTRALENFEKAQQTHQDAMKSYRKDSIKYAQLLKNRVEEIELFKNWAVEHQKELNEWILNYQDVRMLPECGKELVKYIKGVRSLSNAREYMIQEAQRAGLHSLANRIDDLYLNIDSVRLMVSKLGKTVKAYKGGWVSFSLVEVKGDIHQNNKFFMDLENIKDLGNIALLSLNKKLREASLKNLEMETYTRSFNYVAQNEIFNQVDAMVEELKNIQSEFKAINANNNRLAWLNWWENLNYDQLSEADKNQYDALAINGKEAFVEAIIEKQAEKERLETVEAWEKNYYEQLTLNERKDYNELTLKDKVYFIKNFLQFRIKQALHATGISSLGWINCDKFRSAGERMQLVAKSEVKKGMQVKYYLCFKDIRSVMPMHISSTKEVISNNIPKNQNVTIIGIAVSGSGDVSVSKTEGKVADLHDKPLNTFVAAKLSDLQNLF